MHDFYALHEECGVFGPYDLTGENIAPSIYYGLFASLKTEPKKRNFGK